MTSTIFTSRLRRLADVESARATCEPPYDFAEFTRRSASAEAASRGMPVLSAARGAALAASVSALLLGAVMWQRYAVPRVDDTRDTPAIVADVQDAAPALVRVGSLAARNDLEDRIAYFDTVLSESRVSGAPPARVAALEQGRMLMAESLQRVRYAEELMAR